MKRYAAYDPPEYLEWTPGPGVVEAYERTVLDDPERAEIIATLDTSRLSELYRDLVLTRLHDIGLKRWVRTGVLSKAWLGTGEEAVTVGSVSALDRTRDVVCPMIRNAGACLMMGMPMADLFRAYLATADSPSGGRDLHAGDPSTGVIQPISHMGTSVAVMAGVALAFKQRGEDRVAMTWVGDGATRTAACHEGMNFAAVKDVPAVFIIQNNQVALGTRLDQHGAGDISRWPDMYGIPSWSADGNNLLDVLAATTLAVRKCRDGEGPAIVLAETFRMGGHATHDEGEARATFAAEMFEEWGRRDPVGLFEEFLKSKGFSDTDLSSTEDEAAALVDAAAEEALASQHNLPKPDQALYAGFSDGDRLATLTRRPI
jgi:TPP-dependent pyruvate/acetoin dehydrogenase alpha subunit